MIRCLRSMRRRVRLSHPPHYALKFSNLTPVRILLLLLISLGYSSILPPILPHNLLLRRQRSTMGRHQRLKIPATVLGCEEPDVLAAEGVGAGVCGVGALLPEGADGEC